MSRPIRVAYPARISFVMRRGSKVRSMLVRAETAAELGEAAVGEFERPLALKGAAADGSDIDPWIRGGLAWRPIRVEGGRPVTGDELAAYLSGAEPERAVLRALSRALDGSPVSRRLPGLPAAEAEFGERRGWAEPAAGTLSRIETDERADCAGAAARFVAEEVLVADGIALVRLRAGLRLRTGGKFPEEIVAGRGDWARRPFVRADRRESLEGLADATLPPATGAVARLLEALPPSAFDDADLVAMANVLPRAAHQFVEPFAQGRHTASGDLVAAARDCASRLARWAGLGERGLVGPSEAAEALGDIRAGIRLVLGPARSSARSDYLQAAVQALRYVEAVAGPRLPGDDRDAEAIAGFAP